MTRFQHMRFIAKLVLKNILWCILRIYARFYLKKTVFVISYAYGFLGNQLILYSHFISYVREHDCIVVNPAFYAYSHLFKSIHGNILCRYPPPRIFIPLGKRLREILYRITNELLIDIKEGVLKDRHITVLDWGNYNTFEKIWYFDSREFQELVKDNKIIFVRGYRYLDRINFTKHADNIRMFFVPQDQYYANYRRKIEDARREGDVIIGVHVRIRDLLHIMEKLIGEYLYENYHRSLDQRYHFSLNEYRNVMENMESLFPGRKIVFFICSDENISVNIFNRLPVVFGTGDIVEDLYGFSECDYIIGPPSTYSGWAAFYGKVPLYWLTKPEAPESLDCFTIPNQWDGIYLDLGTKSPFLY